MSDLAKENGKDIILANAEVLGNGSASSESSLSDNSIDDIDEDELIVGDDEECDGDEDELEDEDDGDNDYSSTDDSSTTSTSSTVNNQQDNTRVCDCCYCEVFGHGVAPVAPTSRNFQEMRDRLRKRLSKRRQERCQNDQGSECSHATISADPTRSDQSADRTEEGDVDDTGGSNPESFVGRGAGATPLKGNRREQKNNKGLMGDSTIEEILNFINGTPGDKSSSKKKKDKSRSVNNEKVKSKSNNTTTSNAKESRYSEKCHHHHQHQLRHQHPNTPNGNNSNSQHNQGNSTRVSRVSTTVSKRQQHNNSATEQSHAPNPQSRRHKANSKSSTGEASTSQSTCSESPSDDTPDDVFKPRDIDLDDDRLDEFERELEAFKRFCLDSIPLVKKERVRIQLKDSNCFKEFKERPAMKSKLSKDRRSKKGHRLLV